MNFFSSKIVIFSGAWLALWVEHAVPELRVVSSNPTMGYLKKLKKKKKFLFVT